MPSIVPLFFSVKVVSSRLAFAGVGPNSGTPTQIHPKTSESGSTFSHFPVTALAADLAAGF